MSLRPNSLSRSSSMELLNAPSLRTSRYPSKGDKLRRDDLDRDEDTTSDASTACLSLDNDSSHTLSDLQPNKTTKKRVRFNKSKFLGKKTSVKVKVQTIEKVQDPENIWWDASDYNKMKAADAQLAQSEDGKAYILDSVRLFQHVMQQKQPSSDDQDEDSEGASSLPPIHLMAAGCDAGLRGLEQWHGTSSADRQSQRRQTIKSIVRVYRSKIKASEESLLPASLSSSEHDKSSEIDEQVRKFARCLTEKTRRLGTFYGVCDALVADSSCSDDSNQMEMDA